MGPLLDRVGAVWLDAALASTALSALLALAMIGCRQPSRRRGLARAAILGVVVAPGLAWLVPLGQVDILGPAWRGLAWLATPGGSAEGLAWRPGGAAVRGLTVLYLAGVAAGLGWLLLGWWCSAWLAGRSSAPSAAVCALYRGLPCRVRHGRPGLRVATRVRRPILIGLVRPMILIPPALDRPEARDRLRLALLHELAHAEAHDPWFYGLAGGLAQALWFFLPPVWWVRTQMRLDQEFLADAHASGDFGAVGAYASSLLDWAETGTGDRAATPLRQVVEAGPGSALVQRMRMLLRCPFPLERASPPWWRGALPCVALLGTLGLTTLSLRPPPPPSSPAQPALCGHHPSAPGADLAPSASAAPPEAPALPQFRAPRLALEPIPPGPDGRVRPVLLPVALPDRFEINLWVQADPAALTQTRIVGLRLGTLADPPEPTPDGWHRVRLVRSAEGLALWTDGRRVLPTSDDRRPPGRLTLEPPPNYALTIRDLQLGW